MKDSRLPIGINKLSFILLITSFILFHECKAQQLNKQYQWHTFIAKKDSMPLVGKKGKYYRTDAAYILMPIYINNYFKKGYRNLYVQFDLGADLNLYLYSIPFFHLLTKDTKIDTANSPHFSNGNTIRIEKEMKGLLSGYPFDLNNFFFIRPHAGNWSDSALKERLIGTVGASFFKNKILVIDYIHDKFMVVNSFKKLPSRFQKKNAYIPIDSNQYTHHSRILFNIDMGDTIMKDVMFDTGSGPFDFTVRDSTLWEKLTGKRLTDTTNMKISINAWGKKLYMLGANIREKYLPYQIGQFKVLHPTVFFVPDDFPRNIVGNNPFAGEAVVVIDLIHYKIGIFKK